jgi:hypothetical protein
MRAWVKQHFPAIDRFADRFGYWGAFFAAIWFAMSWIASSISGLAQFGWGAVVFAGLAVACLTALSVSVSLALYRYFNPLPPTSPPPPKPISSPPANAATTPSNPEADRDILILMHFTVYQSTVIMLDDLLDSAPDGIVEGPLQLGGDFVLKNAAAQQFIDRARRKLDPGSWRRSDFEGVMRMAEADAERQLEQTPVDQRPSDIDHLALRRWVIVHLQCARGIAFLQRQKLEAEDNLRNQRSGLLERYRARNPN